MISTWYFLHISMCVSSSSSVLEKNLKIGPALLITKQLFYLTLHSISVLDDWENQLYMPWVNPMMVSFIIQLEQSMDSPNLPFL